MLNSIASFKRLILRKVLLSGFSDIGGVYNKKDQQLFTITKKTIRASSWKHPFTKNKIGWHGICRTLSWFYYVLGLNSNTNPTL